MHLHLLAGAGRTAAVAVALRSPVDDPIDPRGPFRQRHVGDVDEPERILIGAVMSQQQALHLVAGPAAQLAPAGAARRLLDPLDLGQMRRRQGRQQRRAQRILERGARQIGPAGAAHERAQLALALGVVDGPPQLAQALAAGRDPLDDMLGPDGCAQLRPGGHELARVEQAHVGGARGRTHVAQDRRSREALDHAVLQPVVLRREQAAVADMDRRQRHGVETPDHRAHAPASA